MVQGRDQLETQTHNVTVFVCLSLEVLKPFDGNS